MAESGTMSFEVVFIDLDHFVNIPGLNSDAVSDHQVGEPIAIDENHP